MDGTNPKVSFIPKSSLVRSESFLERKRPRSVMNIIAMISVVVSVGGYVGGYVWNKSLLDQTVKKNADVAGIQKEFDDSTQVKEAQVFQSRAALAKEILDGHTIISPALDFISSNTLKSIFYSKLVLSNTDKALKVNLSGEAPSYSSLINQKDVLSGKTKELSGFKFSNVALTSFGAVSFDLELVFVPDFVSYVKTIGMLDKTMPRAIATSTDAVTVVHSSDIVVVPGLGKQGAVPVVSTAPTSTPVGGFSGTSTTERIVAVPSLSTSTDSFANPAKVASVASTSTRGSAVTPVPVQKTSAMRSFWSIFKFW